jgi:hypothetical protein
VDAIFAEARRTVRSPPLLNGPIRPVGYREPNPSSNAVHITAFNDTELRQIVLDAFADWERRAAEMRLAQPADDHMREEVLRSLAEEEAYISGPLSDERVQQAVHDCASRILAARDISVEGAPRQYRLVLELTRRALVESARREQERCRGVYDDRAFDSLFNGVSSLSPGQAERSITLANLIERFKADPGRADRRNKTVASYELSRHCPHGRGPTTRRKVVSGCTTARARARRLVARRRCRCGLWRGLRPSTLAVEIAEVRYPDLDLSHLYLQPVANHERPAAA